MTVIELKEATGIKYAIRCACGFLGASRATLAAAGAEIDKHQAEVFPRPSERRECSGAPGEFPEDVWGALHHVWTWAVGKPGYRKSAFQLLERDLLTMHVSERHHARQRTGAVGGDNGRNGAAHPGNVAFVDQQVSRDR